MNLDWIRHSARYLYQFTSAVCGNEHGSLIINPLPNAGNKLMAINDHEKKEANVEFVEFLHDGWPTVCMVMKWEVKQGVELLVEYGPDYWRVHNTLDTHVRAVSLPSTSTMYSAAFQFHHQTPLAVAGLEAAGQAADRAAARGAGAAQGLSSDELRTPELQ